MEINLITEKIIGCAYTVGNTLGPGFLEKVYENALAHEIQKASLKVKTQVPVKVYYDNIIVGEYFADLLVEDKVIIELKASKNIEKIHMAQCLNYLKATNLKICLLINFGKPKIQIKRIVRGL
ncbi:MAG: GxxExxY protein [Chloroflexi bacterium]|nr:GxxExxY protein [Chloroflexota bacterium]